MSAGGGGGSANARSYQPSLSHVLGNKLPLNPTYAADTALERTSLGCEHVRSIASPHALQVKEGYPNAEANLPGSTTQS